MPGVRIPWTRTPLYDFWMQLSLHNSAEPELLSSPQKRWLRLLRMCKLCRDLSKAKILVAHTGNKIEQCWKSFWLVCLSEVRDLWSSWRLGCKCWQLIRNGPKSLIWYVVGKIILLPAMSISCPLLFLLWETAWASQNTSQVLLRAPSGCHHWFLFYIGLPLHCFQE